MKAEPRCLGSLVCVESEQDRLTLPLTGLTAVPSALRPRRAAALGSRRMYPRVFFELWGESDMHQIMKLALAAVAGALASGTVLYAQAGAPPPKVRIAIYRAAPGQQVALLKWLDAQNRAAAAAGVPIGQLYAHTDGDSWDYLAVDPATTPAQDAAVDAAARKMGMPTGPAANLEFRRYIATHTDTFAIGPVTPAQYLAMAGQ